MATSTLAWEPAEVADLSEQPAESTEADRRPAGTGEYVVEQGECIYSIAGDAGHFWKTIWDDVANSELRRIRKNPGILLPGDRVHIPGIRPKEEACVTDKRHTFVRLGEPAFFELRILRRPRSLRPANSEGAPAPDDDRAAPAGVDEGPAAVAGDVGTGEWGDVDLPEEDAEAMAASEETTDSYAEESAEQAAASAPQPTEEDQPRANERFRLDVDGREITGVTDSEGCLRVAIPAGARHGRLVIGPENDQAVYDLLFGGVDPIDEVTGVQQRLVNLGFSCGSESGRMGTQTRAALRDFQRQHQLPETGQLDDSTRAKLVEVHRS